VLLWLSQFDRAAFVTFTDAIPALRNAAITWLSMTVCLGAETV
jgi:hypothetical protein